MKEILEGFRSAIQLLISMDSEIYGVVLLSLYVSLSAVVISSLLAVPTGIIIGTKTFPLKKIVG